MNSDDDVVHLARQEAQAVSHRRLQRSLHSADAHTTARARREYIDTLRSASTRAIESLSQQENTLSTDQTSNPGDQQQQEQEQHPADRYPFPPHWPITGPFANTDHQE